MHLLQLFIAMLVGGAVSGPIYERLAEDARRIGMLALLSVPCAAALLWGSLHCHGPARLALWFAAMIGASLAGAGGPRWQRARLLSRASSSGGRSSGAV